MARYIDAEKIERTILDLRIRTDIGSAECYAYTQALRAIHHTYTADVEEVKHGEWSHLGGDEWCCTNCGDVITTEGSWDKPTKKYCNECGAKMDGGKANGKE